MYTESFLCSVMNILSTDIGRLLNRISPVTAISCKAQHSLLAATSRLHFHFRFRCRFPVW